MINKKLGSFILIVLFNTFLITTNAYQATVDGYNAVTNEDHLEDYYVDDLLNHPDVVNHPAFPILERRALGFQKSQRSSSKLDFVRDMFHLARRGFGSRQGFGGLAAGLRGQGSSMISLGLGTFSSVGTVLQATQISTLSDDLNSALSRIGALETSLAGTASTVATLSSTVSTLSGNYDTTKACLNTVSTYTKEIDDAQAAVPSTNANVITWGAAVHGKTAPAVCS